MGRRRRDRKVDLTKLDWPRARRIFGDAPPVRDVWQMQFDYNYAALLRLGRTPHDQIDFEDLWYYHEDLMYQELQPDLFAYVFPACLMFWHQTLMDGSEHDREFHCGVRTGNVLEKMLDAAQLADVLAWFRDSFLMKLDHERLSETESNYAWLYRFNSLGLILDDLRPMWDPWWECSTPGRAVAVLQYLCGLMYDPLEDNPPWWPYLYETDAYVFGDDARWRPENIGLIRRTLTWGFVQDRLAAATSRLQGEPEQPHCERMRDDLPRCRERVEFRIEELPELFDRNTSACDGWSI